MKRIGLLFALVAAFIAAWRQLDEVPLLVIGQPSSSGTLQQCKEAPFFAALPAATGLPLRVSYRPVEQAGFKDTHQLKMVQDGLFDLVSLRFLQNRSAEPLLEGIDMAGMIGDFATARKVVAAYSPTIDRALQRRFSAKLLGVWTFGPQEFFSRVPLRGMADLEGLKVRIGDATLAPLVSGLGGIPAVIPFDETRQALEIGLVDCAVTSAASATYAGWTEAAPHYLPVAVHFGLNGYVMSLKKWNALSASQQKKLAQAFDAHIADLWRYSEDLHREALAGGRGLVSSRGTPAELVIVEPQPDDMHAMQKQAFTAAFVSWADRCEAVHPGAVLEWREALAPIVSAIELLP
jgi:TRAP-type transport system periplasmic protein